MFSDIIVKPTLVVLKRKAENNLLKMIDKARRSGVIFRPHFKTHQSKEIGELFRKHGIQKITVSSVDMARFFAEDGWNDITIAFPVNIREWQAIDELAGNINLNLLTESVEVTEFLIQHLTHGVRFFIKIDTGYHRTGLPAGSPETDLIIQKINRSDKHSFAGFLTHAGHNYSAKGKQEILSNMAYAARQLQSLKTRYPDSIISYGDTPSCSMAAQCEGFDEIRPGNFIYYDVMQYHIGSCALDDIAVAAACPVVAVHPERNELVIYGGAVHLSKETIEADHHFKLFGYVVRFTENGWTEPLPGAYVSSLSQEHGIIKMPADLIKNYRPGDLIGVLPVHSCLTANLLRKPLII